MRTALIVTVDMGGNVPPLIGIGKELARRGWRVVVHADAAAGRTAEAAGLEAVPAAGAPYDPAQPRSAREAFRDLPRLWADRVRGRDAVATARRIRADVAIVDVLLVGALAELERAGVRTAVAAHSTWEGLRPMLGGPMGAMMRLRGTGAASAIAAADRVLVLSAERLGQAVPLPRNARITGPVLQEAPAPRSVGERPLVLVSLSSVAFPGQREALQRVLDAVAALPVDVRAATGRAVTADGLRVGANTVIEPVIDHGGLMPRAAAIVTHGGHATAVRALAHGVPMLVVPMHPMMDQPRIGRAVAAAGAGLAVSKTAPVDELRTALSRLLDAESFAEAAARVGGELVAADGLRAAADEVESLVGAPADPEVAVESPS